MSTTERMLHRRTLRILHTEPPPPDRPASVSRTWTLRLYHRHAYRSAAELMQREGVPEEESEVLTVPAGTATIYRVGEGGPAFVSLDEAWALWLSDPSVTLHSVPVYRMPQRTILRCGP